MIKSFTVLIFCLLSTTGFADSKILCFFSLEKIPGMGLHGTKVGHHAARMILPEIPSGNSTVATKLEGSLLDGNDAGVNSFGFPSLYVDVFAKMSCRSAEGKVICHEETSGEGVYPALVVTIAKDLREAVLGESSRLVYANDYRKWNGLCYRDPIETQIKN